MVFIAMIPVFLVLVSGSLLAAAVSKRRFEETLPLTCGGIPVLLFFGGLVFGLRAAFLLVLLASAGMVVFSVAWLIRKRSWRETAGRFLSPGFLLFCVFFVSLLWIHRDRPANGFDEFSHWMDVVKAMTALDDFGTNPEAHILFRDYPPGMALFEYFFQKAHLLVAPGAGFTEWLCYPAYQLLAFSFFFPALKKLAWKQVIPVGIMAAIACLGSLALYDYALTQTYIDPFLGLATGAGLCLLCTQEEKDPVADAAFLLLLFALVMSKDTGLYCACILGIAAGVIRLVHLRKGIKKRRFLALSLFILGIVLSIALPKLLWKAHYTAAGYRKVFGQPIDWNVVWEVLAGTNTGWQGNAFRHYLNALLTSPVEIGSTGISITYPILLAAETAVLFLLVFVRRKKKGNGQRLTVAIAAVTMTILYSVGMGFIYIFKFGESGAMNLLSFDRYLRVPYLALLAMILFLLIREWIGAGGKQKWIWMPLFCAVGIAVLPLEKTVSILDRSSVEEEKAFRAPYDRLAEQVLADSNTEHPKVYIVSQHDGGWDYYTLRYCLRPCVSAGWTLAQEGSEEGLVVRSPEEWGEELRDYDYVVLYRADKTLMEQYGGLFAGYADGSAPVQNQTAYRVNHERGQMVKLGANPEDILDDLLLYEPGQVLDFSMPDKVPVHMMKSGFSAPEAGFTWSDGAETVVALKPDVPAGTDLTAVWTYAMTNGTQQCDIEAGEQWLYSDELQNGPQEVRFGIPASAVDEDGILRLRFSFPNACEPGNGDQRLLAVAFESLVLEKDSEE